MKTTRQLPSPQGVAEGATAILKMPIGRTYHSVILTRGGTAFTNAHIAEIRVNANGREIQRMTGADLNSMNLFDGQATASATLTKINFDRVGLNSRQAREATAIGTGAPRVTDPKSAGYNPTPIATLEMEIDISGSTAPTLSAKAVQSGAAPLGGIIKRRSFTYSPSGAGDFEIADLPRGDLINRIWIKSAGNYVTAVKLERDNFRVFDRTATENNFIQTDGVKTPQSNWFVIDPSELGDGDQPIVSLVQDFRLICTTSAADTLSVYVDYFGDLSGN